MSTYKKAEDMTKDELFQLVQQTEERFADSNAIAAELVVELEEKNQDLEKTHAQLSDLGNIVMRSLNEIYAFSLETYDFMFVNQAALDNLGYNETEILNKKPWEIKPEVSEKDFKDKVKDLNSGKLKSLEFNTLHKRKDGTTYPVEVYLQKGSFGGVPAYVAVILDRTKESDLRKQLISSAKLAVVGEMSAGVAHEINNPLAISHGNITSINKILKQENLCDPKVFDKIKKILKAHERIRKIVDGLRVYSRSGVTPTEVVSMGDLVNQTVALLYTSLDSNQVKISVEGDDSKLFANGNQGKLQQVLVNLINNAKDALADCKKKEICISLKESSDDQLIMTVSDTGSGIKKENMDRILDPFFSTKEVGKGTGMGLSIVSEFVREMHGELSVKSELGEGSAFSITLPRVNVADQGVEQEKKAA